MSSDKMKEWEQYYKGTTIAVQPDLFIVRRFSKEQGLQKRQVVIFGCGAGRNAIWLAKRNLYVMATDLSVTALEKVKWWAKIEGVEDQVDALNLDLLDENYKSYGHLGDHCYDYSIFENCLEYFDDDQVISVLLRARSCMRLRDGGRVFVVSRGPRDWAHGTEERSDGWMKLYARGEGFYMKVLAECLGLAHFEVTTEERKRSIYEGPSSSSGERIEQVLYIEGWR